jgi:phage-related protein
MPVVGEAHIIVRALTTNVAKDIKNGFDGVGGEAGKSSLKAGRTLAQKFQDGMNRSVKTTVFGKWADGLREMAPAAEATRDSINQMIISGYKTSAMAPIIIGSIGVIIGGLSALIGSALGAAASFTAIIGVFMAFKLATMVGKMALEGVAEAVQGGVQAQKNYAATLRDTREELQQLKFDAEDAALAEEGAAIALEKAREGLARTQDLPTDSRARREAELQLKQADLAYRRAKDRSNDLNTELRTGAKAREKAIANDPFKDLTPTQRIFAKYLVSIHKQFKDLRELVAKGFLPVLQVQIQRLMKTGFPILKKGFAEISVALGKATKSLTDALLSPDTLSSVNKIFTTMAKVIAKFGPILGNIIKAFADIMAASSPLILRFVNWIDSIASKFSTWIGKLNKDGRLTAFFNRAGQLAADFGTIFGNLIKGVIALVAANFGPGTGGDMILQWLKKATEGFFTLGKDKGGLIKYFQDVAKNFIIMFSGLGDLIGALVELGADPNVGIFWAEVKKATPLVGQMLKKFTPLLPTVGKLVGQFLELISLLADSGGPTMFFETLLGSLKVSTDVLKNDTIQKVLGFSSSVHGLVLGFNTVFKYATMGINYFIGDLIAVLDTIEKLRKGLEGLGKIYKGLEKAIKKAVDWMNKDNWVKKLATKINKALKAALKELRDMYHMLKVAIKDAIAKVKSWNIRQKISTASQKVWNTVTLWGVKAQMAFERAVLASKAALIKLGNAIKNATIWEKLRQTATAAGTAIQQLFTLAMVWTKTALINAGNAIKNWTIWEKLRQIATVIGTAIQAAFNAVMALNPIALIVIAVAALTAGLIYFFTMTDQGKQMWSNFVNFMSNSWNAFAGAFSQGFTAVLGFLQSIVSTVTDSVKGFINFVIDGLNRMIDGANQLLGLLSNVTGGAINWKLSGIPKLADGGIVQPRSGGTLAMIAEAGQAERVEPLDKNGLSKRDKALIAQMSGSGAGGGGVHITVNPSPGMDEISLSNMISRRLAFELKRGSTA